MLILIRERKGQKQMEVVKTRERKRHVYIHVGKIILVKFWATGQYEGVNSRMLKYKKEIEFFSLDVLQFFIIGVQNFWFFCVVSFKSSAECGISCTMPDSAMLVHPDIAQMLD